MARAASGQCRHLLLQPRDIIFSWTRLLGKSHDIRLARKVGGDPAFLEWECPHVRVLTKSLPDQDLLLGTARGCPLQGCHSQTSILLTATEAGGCCEPTTLATAYSAEPYALQLRRSREDCPCFYSLPGQPPVYPLTLSKPDCFRTPSEKIIQGIGFLLCPSPTSFEVTRKRSDFNWGIHLCSPRSLVAGRVLTTSGDSAVSIGHGGIC